MIEDRIREFASNNLHEPVRERTIEQRREWRNRLLKNFRDLKTMQGVRVTIDDICEAAARPGGKKVTKSGHGSFAEYKSGKMKDSHPAAIRLDAVLRGDVPLKLNQAGKSNKQEKDEFSDDPTVVFTLDPSVRLKI